MRKIYTAALLLLSLSAGAQEPLIKSELPQIAPPSPTVAALMKFEEVPVNNYTGIPDISIPLYSVQSHSNSIGVNLSLNYHPSGIAASEVASYTGLGWSLFAGGSVSRTVRGYPDEYARVDGTVKLGLYQNTSIGIFNNTYYEAMGAFGSPSASPIMEKFLWDTQEKGRYDSEHDLYQFNFMGKSGRFYIKKNSAGELKVVRLDNTDALVINFNYTYDAPTHKYTFLGFEALDDLGNRYVFDIPETTLQANVTQNSYYGDVTSISGDNYSYISAFQLSKIYDANNQLLVNFVYNLESETIQEVTTDVTSEQNLLVEPNPLPLASLASNCPGELYKLDAKLSENRSTRSTNTKKLKTIEVIGKAKIDFITEMGREDYNVANASTAPKLKTVTVKSWDGTPVKKYDLSYAYSELSAQYGKRLILTKVEVGNYTDSKKETYALYYAQNPSGFQTIGTDLWGYFNAKPYLSDAGTYRGTDTKTIKTDVLQKIKFPTGGAAVFDFEANSYSHIGSQAVTNFDENPENWVTATQNLSFQSVNGATAPQTLDVATVGDAYVRFSLQLSSGTEMGTFTIRRDVNGTSTVYSQFNCGSNSQCLTNDIYLEPGYSYTLSYNWFSSTTTSSVNVTATYRTRINDGRFPQPVKQYLYGGGLRIRSIGHFEDGNVSPNYFDGTIYQNGLVPSRKKNYDYSFFGTTKSSGSLAYGKPVYSYIKTRKHDIVCAIGLEIGIELSYNTIGSLNNLMSQKTHGADVGYQNVSVFETDTSGNKNGRSEFIYTSPIDNPEDADAYTQHYPFTPSRNLDHRRGLLKNEKHFTGTKALTQTVYEHTLVEGEETTGLKVFRGATTCPFSGLFYTYENVLSRIADCQGNPQPTLPCVRVCYTDVYDYVGYKKNIEAFGWVQFSRKTTTDYFDPAQTVKTIEEVTYNPANKQPTAKKTITSESPLEFQLSEYTYHGFANNRISEIAQVSVSDQNGALSGTSRGYANFGGIYRPSAVSTSKGTQLYEERMKYNSYDEYGNPLEVQQVNGSKISYIWGYGKTVPVAKIENMAYASIPTGLITAIQNASNAIPYSEAALLTALDNLRNDTALASALVTAYAYLPLVGISATIDAKGEKTTYMYDSFGRLKAVKDNEGKMLSQNSYHYRTQN